MKLPYDRVALVLQGGGALGAYQGGVFEGLTEAGIECDWAAGISIGAINAALIAGNEPAQRVSNASAHQAARRRERRLVGSRPRVRCSKGSVGFSCRVCRRPRSARNPRRAS
jgi:predicted acylesterase/phospholipase RssA